MTNNTAYKLLENLSKLENIDYPVLVAYSIAHAKKLLTDALQPYSVSREAVISKYLARLPEGADTITAKDNPELYKACAEELMKIGEIPLDVDEKFRKFPVSELGDMKVSIEAMETLAFLIAEDE